jgi:hypothetical protein
LSYQEAGSFPPRRLLFVDIGHVAYWPFAAFPAAHYSDRYWSKSGVRRETGKEQMVQVHHDEGVANRIDPESCAAAREGISEALTGERIGQPLSRESTLILGADVVPLTEGNTDGRDIASAQTARRGRRHWHVRKFLAREPGDPTTEHRHVADLVRIGKARSRSR